MNKKMFPVEDIEMLEYGEGPDGYAPLSKTFLNHSRWSVWYNIVFAHGDKIWQVAYPTPATEMQESELWSDEIEAVEVEPFAHPTTRYRAVK